MKNPDPAAGPGGQGGGLLGGIGDLIGAAAGGGSLTGGLSDLLNSFKQSGQEKVADSRPASQPKG